MKKSYLPQPFKRSIEYAHEGYMQFTEWVVNEEIPRVQGISNKFYGKWIVNGKGNLPVYLTTTQLFKRFLKLLNKPGK